MEKQKSFCVLFGKSSQDLSTITASQRTRTKSVLANWPSLYFGSKTQLHARSEGACRMWNQVRPSSALVPEEKVTC